MHTFFYGWRRKAGIVTLVVACLVACVWVRSIKASEAVMIGITQTVLVSHNGCVSWWQSSWASEFPIWTKDIERYINYGSANHSECFSIATGRQRGTISINFEATFAWNIPYCLIALPLTLLSAYLILWKPRKRA